MQSNRDVRKTGRWGMWPLAAAAIGAFLLVGTTAAPAQAGSGFEHGFEDQLGRIFAFEAVNLGKHVLFQGVSHPYRGSHHRSYYRSNRSDHHRNVRYEGHQGHGKHYWKSQRRHHKRHDRWHRKHGRDDYRDRHDGDRGREHRHDRSCRSSHAY